MPLHGERGGPMRCSLCIGQWHGEHGKRRRHGRIVIRAIAAYLRNGGSSKDIDKLQQSAVVGDFLGGTVLGLGHESLADPLGYLTGSAVRSFSDEIIELTSELLADAIKLAHPDYHPPERQDLARRTTQGLLALQPFVFPAPKPKPAPQPGPSFEAAPRPRETAVAESKPAYPCADCRDTVPYFYCNACRAEWDKRLAAERERERIKQRKCYRQRQERRWISKECAACGASFRISGGAAKVKRKDARFCSPKCRQRAHRSVTAKSRSPDGSLISRNAAASSHAGGRR
jgi:hypothetical protein